MKKILLTLLLHLCFMAGQGQTTTSTSAVNTNSLNAQWAKFTQLAEKKQYKQAVEEGIKVSISLTENRQYKEAFATCRQLDALIYAGEQEMKRPDYLLRFLVTQERLRMYTRLKNSEQSKLQLNQLQAYANQLKSDSLTESLLFTEAGYYRTFDMPDKSLACYKQLLHKRAAGKDEQGIEQCYKEMLNYAEKQKDAPLTTAMRKLYANWQDSIKAVRAASELTSLQEKYDITQKTLQEKEESIGVNHSIIAILCVISVLLAAGLLFITALLLKHIRLAKKLKQSLAIANDNNEQKSNFIANISTQMEPAFHAMEQGITEGASTRVMQNKIFALKNFIAHIQAYATLEQTREDLYPVKEININTLCESIVEKAKAQFKPEVEAVLNVPRVNIKTNAEHLEYILLHLLKNAALYTESGKITLEFKKRSAHTLQFIVTDTGIGIPADKCPKLFTPFAEIRDLEQGDGLGIPTCNLIAYKLNGKLTLDTEYKKGTRFILEIHI